MTTTGEHQNQTVAAGRTDPGTMQAIVQEAYGPADVLKLGTVDRPSIAADEVLIEVHAAGIDRGVWHLMTGLPYLVRLAGYGVRKPKNPVPGMDVAGRVVAVGAAVTRLRPGDDVFGIAKGSFAEYAVADQEKLAPKPAGASFEQAAIAAVSGITALQALTEVGHVQPGQSVLVIGASGGVGTYAVQLAKALGAVVTTVSGPRGTEMLGSLGADHVLDYTREDFVDGVHHYDLILDIGGRNSLRRLRGALAPKGTLVIVGGEGGNRVTGGVGRQLRAVLMSPFVGQRLTTFIASEDRASVERLAGHIERREVVPVVGRRYRLDEVADAMRRLESDHANGKAVVVVRG